MALITATLDADTLLGGDGNDLFFIASAAHAAEDLITGGGGTDEIRFASTSVDGETLFLDPTTDVELVTLGTGQAAAPVLTGTAPNDVIASAMSTAVMLVGNAGANMLVGGSANDTIQAGAGADVLFGGDGNDRLEGGAGADLADGEQGSDTYVVSLTADLTAADSIADSGDESDTDVLEVRLASGVLAVGLNVTGIEVINVTGATAASAAGVAVNAAVFTHYHINGNAAANTLAGGSGGDTITGGGGGDSLSGGGAGDLFLVASVADSVGDKYVGGAEFDMVQFAPTLPPVGTATTFIIAAASLSTELYQLVGDQAYNINAAALTSAAPVLIFGNSAANILTGGAGADSLAGYGGNDTLVGGAGIDAADYRDVGAAVTVSLTAATATGDTAGTDSLTGIEGVLGSLYDDVITGSALANRLHGDEGNDTIAGLAGADTLIGWLGNDVFLVGSGAQGAGDLFIGDIGFDELRFTSTLRGDTLTLRASVPDVEHILVSDKDGLTTGTTALNVNAVYALGAVWVTGNDGVNAMTGSAYADTLEGGGGNDRLDGRRGDDSLNGGGGRDVLLGGVGNDTLDGGLGNDTLYGGAGDDLYNVSSTGDVFVETVGGGFDLIQGTVSVVVSANIEEVILLGAGSTSASAASLVTSVQMLGAEGSNTLIGGSAADSLYGSSGSDLLAGGGGDDYLDGGTDFSDQADYSSLATALSIDFSEGTFTIGGALGNDTLVSIEGVLAGSGNDTLLGSDASNAISGGGGNDLISGGGDSDQLNGGAGDDSLTGDAGGDNLTGGSGADTLLGGDDSDAFITNLGDGNDQIDGGDGDDMILFSGISSGVAVDLDAGTSSGEGGNDTLVSIESAVGNLGNDTLLGTAGSNNLGGGGGNDSIDGRGDNDVLQGDAGNDTLQGGSGDDLIFVLTASDGDDSMDGGSGSDFLSFLTVTPTGFSIDLAAGSMTGAGNDTFTSIESVGTGSGNDSLHGTSADNYLQSAAGNDTLSGGAGNDTLEGATDDDLFVFDTAVNGELDYIYGFASGGDRFQLDDSFFTGLLAHSTAGVLDGSAFRSAEDLDSGGSAGQYILYDNTIGFVYYDANADGNAADAVLFAFVSDLPALAASDILVIA